MGRLCILSFILLAVAFVALNTFLPYAVLLLLAAVGLGALCGLRETPR